MNSIRADLKYNEYPVLRQMIPNVTPYREWTLPTEHQWAKLAMVWLDLVWLVLMLIYTRCVRKFAWVRKWHHCSVGRSLLWERVTSFRMEVCMAFIVIFCTAQLPKMHGFRATLVEHARLCWHLCETEAVWCEVQTPSGALTLWGK